MHQNFATNTNGAPFTHRSSGSYSADARLYSAAPSTVGSSTRLSDLDEDTKANFAKWKWPSHPDDKNTNGVPDLSHPLPRDVFDDSNLRNGSSASYDPKSSLQNDDQAFKMGSFSPDKQQQLLQQQQEQQQHIPDEFLHKLLTKDDSNIQDEPPASLTAAKLRRTASLSEIEPIIFGGESLVPLAGLIKLYEDAKGLKSQLYDRMKVALAVSDKMTNHSTEAEEHLVRVQRDNVLIKYHIHASTKKEESVRHRVRELEAFTARIDYEIATLTVKLRDVDQSVMAFAAKVDTAESRWKLLKKSRTDRNRGWFSFWNYIF